MLDLDQVYDIAREVYEDLSFSDPRDEIIVDEDDGEITVKYISAALRIGGDEAYTFVTFDEEDFSTWGDDYVFVPGILRGIGYGRELVEQREELLRRVGCRTLEIVPVFRRKEYWRKLRKF